MDYSKMTLREKVLQTFVANLSAVKKVGSIHEFFEKYPVGGLYYSKSGDIPDLAALMESGTVGGKRDYILECKRASKTPLLICADSANIEDGMQMPRFPALGATHDPELAYRVGRARGMQMNYNHIDWILGPCIDLNASRCTDSISGSMTDDPILNGELFAAVVRGTQDEGVAATVKHFPGLGTHHVNFHYGPGQNTMDFDTWMATYGHSYLRCFEENALVVMTSHLTFRAYDNEGNDGLFPICTYSKKLTEELLKGKLGFKGAVVTDALIMGGMASDDRVMDAVNAFRSGADFLLWPPMEAADAIVERLESGEIPMSRLEDALSRIEYVRRAIGAWDAIREEKPADPAFVEATYREVVRRAPELVRNRRGLIPLNKKKIKKILVIGNAANDGGLDQLEPFCELLREKGFLVDFRRYLNTCWAEYVHEKTDSYDLVIQLLWAPSAIGPIQACNATVWAFHMVDKAKRMVVNFSSPFFADDYYPEDDTFVTAHQPASKEGFRAVVDCMVGQQPFEGKSPLKLSDWYTNA